MKIALITVGVLLYIGAAVLFPVPVLGSTIAAGVFWLAIWRPKA